ncbi:MAG: elongation factor G, partial [Bdellovibrionales bacterium]|nr:elongation factor G [Bdellovibrionales bacterium]
YYFDGENGENVRVEEIPADLAAQAKEKREELITRLADVDDEIGEKFLMEEEIMPDLFDKAIRRATISLKFVPVFMGSAFKNKGVQPLLDGVSAYLPNPTEVVNEGLNQNKSEEKEVIPNDPSKPLVALAFKLEDGRYGQLTYMRVYSGTVKKGDMIYNVSAGDRKIKVPRIVRMHSNQMVDVEEARAGDICAFFGVECASGDTFTDGTVRYTMTSMFIPNAVISLAVSPKDKSGQANFSKALNRFTKEDPTLRVHRDEESAETIMSGMGELHLEIYIERMKREYNCEVVAGRPQVAFRETIQQATDFSYTHKKQTGGSGQYAKVKLVVEPFESEEGFVFANETFGGSIPKEFISAVEKGVRESLESGVLAGYPMSNVKVSVVDGGYHEVDSSEMAFKICSAICAKEAFRKAKPVLLEPVMRVEVVVPDEYMGSVNGDLISRRGRLEGTEILGGTHFIKSMVPLSEMFGYATDLRSKTQGRGAFTMHFGQYEEVPRSIADEIVSRVQGKVTN